MENMCRELLRKAACQTFRAVGYTSITDSAADTLADILQKFIEEVGHTAHEASDLAGRTESNLFDVEYAMYDLGQTVRNVERRAKQLEEIVFEKPIADFPIRKENLKAGKEPENWEREDHIPHFLPPFPEEHTYKQSAVYDKVTQDTDNKVTKLSKQRKQIEKHLVEFVGGKKNEKTEEAKKSSGDTKKESSNDPWSALFVLQPKEPKKLKTVDRVPVNQVLKHNLVQPTQTSTYSVTSSFDGDAERAKKKQKTEGILSYSHVTVNEQDDDDEEEEKEKDNDAKSKEVKGKDAVGEVEDKQD